MKHLVYFFLSLTLLSCSKSSNSPVQSTSTSGSIQYKINGDLFTIDNANLLNGEEVSVTRQLHGIGLPQTRYLLNAQIKPDFFLTITLVTDSLYEINYHYDSATVSNNFAEFTFDLDNKGQFRSLYFSTDHVDVNISSYKNSRVNGTFTGRLSEVTGSLSDYYKRGSIYITEGVFANVPVTY